MRFRSTALIFAGLILTAFAGKAFCGAFDDAEEWGGYWRSSEPRFGRRYEVPPTLYYGHAPPVERPPSRVYPGDGTLYRNIPATRESGAQNVSPYHPQFYGRGHYYGPWFDPYYAPGRVSYGGYRYGWW